MLDAANYTAERARVDGFEVVRLKDTASDVEVSVVPSIGNNAYEMKVRGQNILWSAYKTLTELRDKPTMIGNPLLAPWANRIDGDSYYANGRKYLLNADLKNFRQDANKQPIHGLVVYAKEWQVTNVKADDKAAEVTSRLEFWKRPDWMAQFPFAHNIDMTYRLSGGVLEVRTRIENFATEAMPLSLGYHTYYQIPGVPRDEWQAHIPARDQVVLSPTLVPTGERKPVALGDAVSLKDRPLDDVFTNLIRDGQGRADFWGEARGKKVTVSFGPKYFVAVVWLPPGREFMCFEPMTGVTNAFNLAHRGLYKELQSVPASGTWEESFWISTSGF
jgi:aldose 1-epimerase